MDAPHDCLPGSPSCPQATGFLREREATAADGADVEWFSGEGMPCHLVIGRTLGAMPLAMLLSGAAPGLTDERGIRIAGDTLVAVFNAAPTRVTFRLPRIPRPWRWFLAFDTALPAESDGRRTIAGGQTYQVEARSVVVFRSPVSPPPTRAGPRPRGPAR